MFQRTRIPVFAIAFVLVAQLIFFDLMVYKLEFANLSDLIINTLHFDGFVFIIKVLRMVSCATATFVTARFSFCQASLTVWLSNSTLKFTFAFKALNTLIIVSKRASVRLFSSLEICAFFTPTN
jgi:hypothetical protein